MMYAQPTDGVVTAVVESAGALTEAHCIPIDTCDVTLLGQRWTGSAFEPIPIDPVPQALDPLGLIDLMQTAGGLTDAALVSARDDPAMAPFWIRLQLAREILPTDPRTQAGLAALAAAGYLPSGTAAVLSAWPTT